MLKYLLLSIFIILLMFNSCTESLEPEYFNPHDPKSNNYKPTAIDSLSLKFIFVDMGIELTWSDNSNGESIFEIERRDAPSVEFIKVGEVPANSTSYFDSFIPSLNAHYEYRIKTISSNDNYSYSEVVRYSHDIFSKPTSLSVVHQNTGSLKLSWIDSNTIEDGFIIKMRKPNIPGSNFEVIGNVGKDINLFIVTDLDTNIVYEFSVTAFNSYYQAGCDTTISTIFGIEIYLNWQSNTHLATQSTRFSPKSNLLAIGACVENISFYDITTFEYRTTNFAQNFIEFNSNGTKLGILDNWSSANPVSIVDVNSLNIDQVINFPSTGFSFAPDGLKIFIWDENNQILRLVDLSTGNSIWSKNISQIYDAKFNYNGDKIYCNTGTQILILDALSGNIINLIDPQEYGVASFVLSDDEKYLYIVASISTNYGYGPLEIWDLQTLSLVKVINLNASLIEISPDQRFIVAGNSDFAIFRTSDFEKVANFNPSWGGMIFSFSFNPYSSLIGVCSMYDYPKVFNLNRKWIKRF
ncbi:MAG: hypothetical protein IPI19_11855 [Ignavibacteriales bacterium]|nr:hypothetical protein [Ignavibacteriales bacterium]